jgi:hypothetical protein
MTQQPAKSFHARKPTIVSLLIFFLLLGTAGLVRHLESSDHANSGWTAPFHKAAETVHFGKLRS